jgi:hypothetical protein
MAATSSQLFGNWLSNNIQGSIGGLNKDWSTAFKTPLNTTQVLPVKPEATPGVVSGYMNSPDLDLIRGEKDDTIRGVMLNDYLRRQGEQKDIANLSNSIKTIRDQQYEDRIKMRPLEFQELMARKALDAITSVGDIPRRIAAIRQMYGPETIRGFGLPVEALNQGPRARYFS